MMWLLTILVLGKLPVSVAILHSEADCHDRGQMVSVAVGAVVRPVYPVGFECLALPVE